MYCVQWAGVCGVQWLSVYGVKWLSVYGVQWLSVYGVKWLSVYGAQWLRVYGGEKMHNDKSVSNMWPAYPHFHLPAWALRYKDNLGEARAFGIKKGFSNGLSMGFVWMVIFCSYALGFWYGGRLTRDEPENYTVGKMLIVSQDF